MPGLFCAFLLRMSVHTASPYNYNITSVHCAQLLSSAVANTVVTIVPLHGTCILYLLTQRSCLQAQHALLAVPWPGSVLALPKCRTILGADRRVGVAQSGIATCCIMCVSTYVCSLLPAMPSLLEKVPTSN